MRRLLLVFAHEGTAKVLVAATLLPLAGACGGDTGSDGQGSGSGGNPSSTGGLRGIGGFSVGTGGTVAVGGGATGGSVSCPDWYSQSSYVVELAAGGHTLADVAQTCGWGGTFPAGAPAARLTIRFDPSQPTVSLGSLEFAPEVTARAGYRTLLPVNVIETQQLEVRNVRGGETADFELVTQDGTQPFLSESFTFTATMTLACAPELSSTREFLFEAEVTLCGSYDTPQWVSSGDVCTLCYPMAEMAAMPLATPPRAPDGLPLPDVLDFSIKPIVRDGRTVVLTLDPPRRDADIQLEWRVSAGELRLAAADVAVWTLPDEAGAHQVQVAAESAQAAGIATYLCRDEV